MKKFFVILLIAIVAVSCNRKDDDLTPHVSAGVTIDPIYGFRVQLGISFGHPATYGYTYYFDDRFPANVDVVVVYVASPPVDMRNFAIFDRDGNALGTADCFNSDWKASNAYYSFLQNWDYSKKGMCPILTSGWNGWTHGSPNHVKAIG